MGIQKDLITGELGERLVAEHLARAGFSSNFNNDKKYDLYCTHDDKREFTVEVKNDLYAARSGNVAIEIWNPKSEKPSGLMVTEADLWAHLTNNMVHVAKTSDLRKFIDRNRPLRIIGEGGDGNATIMLYPLESIFEAVFHRIDKLSDADLKALLGVLLDDNS